MENHPIMFVILALIWSISMSYKIIKMLIFLVIMICKWVTKKFKERIVDSNVNR